MRKINDKKAVSLMLSYVLLILIAFSIGVLIYAWIKNFAPTEGEECPEGVSFFIRDYSCNSETDTITLTISNKGRFNVDGFVVRGTDTAGETPTINLKASVIDGKLNELSEGMNIINDRPLAPNQQESYEFEYGGVLAEELVRISAGPIRLQEVEGEEKPLICKNSFITIDVECV